MSDKSYTYWPDIIIAVLCTCIMIGMLLFIFRDTLFGYCGCAEIEPVVAAEEIDGPALDVESTRMYFDVPLDEALQDHIFDTCEYYSVDPAIVIAMIERESRFKADSIGDSGRSFGLMQIQVIWHEERMRRLGAWDILDPYLNVTVGVDYIHELLGYGRGMEWTLMAYNGGPSYANRMSKDGLVSDYAKEILVRAHELGGS